MVGGNEAVQRRTQCCTSGVTVTLGGAICAREARMHVLVSGRPGHPEHRTSIGTRSIRSTVIVPSWAGSNSQRISCSIMAVLICLFVGPLRVTSRTEPSRDSQFCPARPCKAWPSTTRERLHRSRAAFVIAGAAESVIRLDHDARLSIKAWPQSPNDPLRRSSPERACSTPAHGYASFPERRDWRRHLSDASAPSRYGKQRSIRTVKRRILAGWTGVQVFPHPV